jgi:ABC-type antimicrobial peptide transport system permease subunit
MVGLGFAMLLARVVESKLYGVKPVDSATLSISAVLLLAITLMSGLVPAVRASRVKMMDALRHE